MKVCTFGELLVDVTPYGRSDKGYPVCEFNPGGAPANVAVALKNLGVDASFVGQVGDDHYGRFLKSVLDSKGVDTTGLILNPMYPTSLAIVSLGDGGERSFSFYRKNGADVSVSFNPLFQTKLEEADAFHCGSVSLSDEPARSATLDMLKYTHHLGKVVSFDVNLRALLWDDLHEAKKMIEKSLPFVDILKVSEEELVFLKADLTEEEALASLAKEHPISMILVTYGDKGSAVYYKNNMIKVPAYKVDSIDTTGAGDAFFGAFLASVYDSKKTLEAFTTNELKQYLKRANACGAIATLKKGAIGSLPNLKELNAFLEK
jgi:sugar/nucleoside kinase (ribokinase family)